MQRRKTEKKLKKFIELKNLTKARTLNEQLIIEMEVRCYLFDEKLEIQTMPEPDSLKAF